MITNEFQYRNTKSILNDFQVTLDELEETANSAVKPKLRAIEVAAVRSQMESLAEELADYESLRTGNVKTLFSSSVLGLADLLVRARIARGWTQAQLAEALGIAVQQVQRYESTGYASASLSRINDVAQALDIEISETAHLKQTG
jgi:ribosome-binding protein aMBF1 (putative translation factor)